MHGTSKSVGNPNNICELAGGRRIGYSDFGPREAPVIFYFHGWPGSRLEAGFLPVSGVRLIGVDRPGYGLSDPSSFRRLNDWPRDIEQLADRLGIARFAVLGVSGGAPYAAATARLLSDRVSALGLVSGLGPVEAPGMAEGRLGFLLDLGRRPIRRGLLLGLARRLILHDRAGDVLCRIRARTPRPAADRVASSDQFNDLVLSSWREAMTRSSEGLAADARIYGEPWGWDLQDITVPSYIWHGRADVIVPDSIGEHYAACIPGAFSTFPESEGHISLILNYVGAITQTLAGRS